LPFGTLFASSFFIVLHLNQCAPATPRLPRRRWGVLPQLATALALHATLGAAALLVDSTLTGPAVPPHRVEPSMPNQVRHLVFLPPELPQIGGGGGGGGNQQQGPIRRAQGVGSDPITLRVRQAPPLPVITPSAAPVVVDVPPIPSIVLDAKPLASGTFEQVGLPTAAMVGGTSTGSGSGGGVGTGRGTGIGSGRGAGLGPGSGGGTGGGAYRPGGSVSAPRVIKEVKPRYTTQALQRMIQGTVVLEVVVTSDGCPSQIRIVQSLDRGLDEQAVLAVTQWQFEPGRLAGAPVDVMVTIMLDFSIR
jgi:TonB family protein